MAKVYWHKFLLLSLCLVFLNTDLIAQDTPPVEEIITRDDIEKFETKKPEKFAPIVMPSTSLSLQDLTPKKLDELLSPLRKIPEKELAAQIKTNASNTQMSFAFEEYPLFSVFVAKLIQDKIAMPHLLKILTNKKRLVSFGMTMLATIIIGIVLRIVLTDDKAGIISSIINRLFRYFVMFTVRIGVIIYFFGSELKPTFDIFMKTFY